jgi:hypothetical protein
MENMGRLQLQLGEIIGDMPSIALIAEHLSDLPDRTVGDISNASSTRHTSDSANPVVS